jgi:hypothetical protein
MQGMSYKPTHVAGDDMTVLKTPEIGKAWDIRVYTTMDLIAADTPSVPRGLGDNSTSYLDGVSRYYLDYCRCNNLPRAAAC